MAREVTISPLSIDLVLPPLHGLQTCRASALESSFLPTPTPDYLVQRMYWLVAPKLGFTAGKMISTMPYSRIGFTK